MQLPAICRVKIDIDKWLNPIVPAPRFERWPKLVSRFFGYRGSPRQDYGELVVWFWAFIGAFCGVSLIEGVFKASSIIQSHNPPVIIASFGASAILTFNTIESPVAQPRNLVLGHFLSAVVGVCIMKLFAMNPDFENLRWLAGALACAIASVVMGITKSVHPPSGATALLPATDPTITALGWYFIPLVLLCSALYLGTALLINNIQRQYPLWFWTPVDLHEKPRRDDDVEKASQHDKHKQPHPSGDMTPPEEEEVRIVISPHEVVVPDWLHLDQFQRDALQGLKDRLAEETHTISPVTSGSTSRPLADQQHMP